MNTSPAASPATIAALELPVPERSGTRFVSVKRRPSPVWPLARRNAWTTRFVASAGRIARALPFEHHLEWACMSLDDDVVPQRQRHAEAVVPRPEIRRRRRRADMDAIHPPKYGGGRLPSVCSIEPTQADHSQGGAHVRRSIALTVNGSRIERDVEPRTLLVYFLREELGLTGTHIGCDTSSCGACTVHLDGEAVKSCTVLAVQADGSAVTTIEGLSDDGLHPVQQAFHETHALQCGYCTPGMIMSATQLLERNPNPTEDEIRDGLEGNLCRCTGYQNIVEAVKHAAAHL